MLSQAQELPVTAPQRAARKVAVVCAVVFTVVLVILWLTTANPLVISRAQLQQSDVVVIARVVDRQRDRIEVLRVLHGGVEPKGQLTVLNLSRVAEKLNDRDDWLMPLAGFRGDYRITVLEDQRTGPLIYPVTREAIEQAKTLLREMGR